MMDLAIDPTTSASKHFDVLAEPDHAKDAWDLLEDGLSVFEEKMEFVPPIPTMEELRREVTLGLEQIARGEIAEGTGDEAFDRAVQRGMALFARDDDSR